MQGESTEGASLPLVLARAEIEYVERGLREHGVAKQLLANKLGYSDRFTFRRRVLRLLKRHPTLRAEFPAVSRLFPESGLR
jgi:hypothetical protein